MIIRGKLIAESPIYRGNARKTLFTRDGDGTERLVSLAGEVAGTAQSLMDAFIGRSSDGKNTGLLHQLWLRLYDSLMPDGLIREVVCRLREECYPKDHFFDLRMGLRLDEDRWASEANANYKMETIFRNSVFDLVIKVDDSALKKSDHEERLFFLLRELEEGRFWFGAGKSKGLGRCRLEMEAPLATPKTIPEASPEANHLTLSLSLDASNPVLVGWNWGKIDPYTPFFAAVEGRLLVGAMRSLPEAIRKRLEMGIGGPILSPEDWKKKFDTYLPKTLAIWLKERSSSERENWIFPSAPVAKLGKGKFPMSAKLLDKIQPLVDKPFSSREAAKSALDEALGGSAAKGKKVLELLQCKKEAGQEFDQEAWREIVEGLGLDKSLAEDLAKSIQSEAKVTEILAKACRTILPRLHEQVDQQIRLLQSDVWIDEEITSREEHVRIKSMLHEGKILDQQWGNPDLVPDGIRASTWRQFVEDHRRVRFQHMLNFKNLQKSITNDKNYIAFLKAYRNRTRQELSQPYNTDFRAGGIGGREVSRTYGKPYDTVFMRMLSWAPSVQGQGLWEIYIPGSTIKGAFRKRASQVLKTLLSDPGKVEELLNCLFGAQRRKGLVSFSDAYLKNPQVPERSWCSMDGVRMDPKTGKPIEEAKSDYLFAYGERLVFQLRLDLQDLDLNDLKVLSLLAQLLQDFQRGDIPLGGEKTCGFGWVKATTSRIDWMTGKPPKADQLSQQIFGEVGSEAFKQDGIWWKLTLEGEQAARGLRLPSLPSLSVEGRKAPQTPPRAREGFISHRSFGGYCGTLALEAEILTPIIVQESGEPSFRVQPDDRSLGTINGWDFFSMAPPSSELRESKRAYALPSKSLKGMIRHLYAMASDSGRPSLNLSNLNPVDSLFGFVGTGSNQAITGRVSISFGFFEEPTLSWFKVPYPYGSWQYAAGQWQQVSPKPVPLLTIGQKWRVFPHAPLAPCVERLENFTPDTPQASYVRAILPGAVCKFSVRFWNLEQEELQRLIWCLVLEKGLAHKMGKHRYLGLGSLRLRLLPDSHLIEWSKRYGQESEESGRLPLRLDQWVNPAVIKYYQDLRKALNAQQL